jgi:hypothetical protein
VTDVPDFRRSEGSSLTDGEWQQIQFLIAAFRELQTATDALETDVADHEARITVLEP